MPGNNDFKTYTKTDLQTYYAGQPPWEINRAQKAYVAVADQITGSVLDAGCGTGEIALFFAARACTVTGIDFIEEAIDRAAKEAAERGLCASFLVKDAMTFKEWSQRFANVIDSGLFHGFGDEDRRRYVEGLATILKPGGRVFLQCFSDAQPGEYGPRRVSKEELHDAFAEGWNIESIEASEVESQGCDEGAKAWFSVVRRTR